ncbi:MAG: LacI family DNA-binding transcriptional regulator [Anaerolineales bacterium]|nr:LacI family DNA-binding transcriptional regulator [Anaerolineales bacterium]
MSDSKSKVTIQDIAAHASVSISTVSRVLRGSAGVSDSKQQAVLQAVEALDYRPNAFARSLASGESMTIGVLTQNFGSPFYDAILGGVMLALEATPYTPIFADGRWHASAERRALQLFDDRRVDGIVVVGGRLAEEELQQVAGRTPLIVVGRELLQMRDRCIYVDNYQAGYRAARYLLDMGHREIAYISARMPYLETVSDVLQRYRGYEQALRDAGIEPDPQLVVEGDLQRQSGLLAVEMLLLRGRTFSAICAANDQMVSGARLALFRRGIRVPDDVSLVGFDDESAAAFMIPPLTTVHQPAAEMGQAAAAAILGLLDGETPAVQVMQGELVIRESVARRR